MNKLIGRVCYLSGESGNYHTTVECFDEKIAIGFNSNLPLLLIGDYIRFENGIGIGKQNSNIYYHTPYDESDKEKWVYCEINDIKYTRFSVYKCGEILDILNRLKKFGYGDKDNDIRSLVYKIESILTS